jgi:hypothetical protein
MSQENDFSDPGSFSADRIRMLERILASVDNPSLAPSYLQIVETLYDFGLLIRQASEDCRLGIEVIEDPLDRSDSLGNVRMIQRPLSGQQTDHLRKLGDQVCLLAHNFLRTRSRENQLVNEEAQADFFLDDWELVKFEDRLSAKRYLRQLKIENRRLDFRNEGLWIRLQKTLKRVAWLNYLRKFVNAVVKKPNTDIDFFHGNRLSLSSSNMKLELTENGKSRMTDCLSWENHGEE